MRRRHRISTNAGTVTQVTAVAALTVGPLLAFSAVASADPQPDVPGVAAAASDASAPMPPGPQPPPPSTVGSPLAQSGSAVHGPGGLPFSLSDLSRNTVEEPDATPLPPGAAPPAQPMSAPLAQNGAPMGPGGLPTATPDLTGNTANEYVLAQNPAPRIPGGPVDATVPNLNPMNNQYMLPRNLKPSAPGKGQLYDVDPGDEKADLNKGEYAKHLWHGYQDGLWTGTLVGRRPKAELNEPLPNTAPPQGTRIPGLGDDSQAPPPDQWHWTPPEAPAPAEGAAPGAPGAPPAPGAPVPATPPGPPDAAPAPPTP